MNTDERTQPQVGDELPELVLEMTATRIVAGAIATRDFMPVHHDRDYARAQGAPDIFMNILSTNAYCGRYLSDWAGPESLVRHLSIRLGVPVFPGSTLHFTGRVTELHHEAAELLVHVELRAANELGDHATGTAVVSIPAPRP
jgi:acyl dehydratase